MPKVKTKSGAKKRFKLTGTGKIKRKNAFKNIWFLPISHTSDFNRISK